MKRSVQYLGTFFGAFCIWLGIFLNQDELSNATWRFYLTIGPPVFAILLFGIGCFTKLVYDISTFNNYPEEIPRLADDIERARTDLKKRGFK